MSALAYAEPLPEVVLAAAYLRISKDKDNDRLAIQRQRQDLEELAAYLGWTIVAWFEDNDISGSGDKKRSGYLRMSDALRMGTVNAVLATEVARLQRGAKEYHEFYEACEGTRAKIAWKGGLADFAKTETIFQLEIWAVMAREELRQLKRRVTRKHQELREKGMPNGGPRPFGYESGGARLREITTYCRVADRQEVTIDEVAIVKDLAKRILAGAALYPLARELNARGIPTITGTLWKPNTIRQLMLRYRNAGWRGTFPIRDGKKSRIEVKVCKGHWPNILDLDTVEALRAKLMSGQQTGVSSSKTMLAGLMFCGTCKSRMYSAGPRSRNGKPAIRCPACGTARIATHVVADPIVAAVQERIGKGALEDALSEAIDPEAVRRVSQLESELVQLAALHGLPRAQGGISYDEWQAARLPKLRELKGLQAALERATQMLGLATVTDLGKEWADLRPEEQRTILAFFVAKITVFPSAGRGRRFEDRVTVEWKR